MNDLLKSQIHDNCRLALPDGLKDLMSDISREVLRAQPQNLYHFITNYLGALLESRETLNIASQVCSDVCNCSCDPIIPELYNELKKIGLNEEDVYNAIQVIENHLKIDQEGNESVFSGKEQSLLLKLLRKTNIDASQLFPVQLAVQKAFKRRSLGRGDLMDIRNELWKQESSEAVHNTLHLYKRNQQKAQTETKELFVTSYYTPCVTTDSSSTLAGSYVTLPLFRPYSVHNSETLSAIPEKEPSSIDYTEKVSELKQNSIKTTNEKSIPEKNKALVVFDTNKHILEDKDDNDKEEHIWVECAETHPTAQVIVNKIKICEETTIPDETKSDELFDDNNDSIPEIEYSDDEVQESIENVESENESCFSSIAESLQDNIE